MTRVTRDKLQDLGWRSGAAIVLAVMLFISLNILSSVWLNSAQLDLTGSRLYTLSDGTAEVISGIDEPMRLKYFISKRLTEKSPVHANFATRVRDLLENFSGLSNGMIHLEVIDPEPYSPEEDQAVVHGLRGVSLDNRSGDQAYFGLVATNSTDEEKVIEYFDPNREQFLEYDLTKMIYGLSHPKKPVVGLLSSMPMGADPQRNFRPWPVFEQVKQFFTTRSLRASDVTIDEDIDILLVVHPQDLSEQKLYAIDQFILSGGRALIFVDPYSEVALAAAEAQNKSQKPGQFGVKARLDANPASTLDKLFDRWGIEFSVEKMVADLGSAQKVSMPGARGGAADYLLWLALRQQNMNDEDVVISDLSAINLATAGTLSLTETSPMEMEPLMESSPQSMLVDVPEDDSLPNPGRLLDEFKSGNKPHVLAARFRGMVETAYPDGPPVGMVDEGEGAQAREDSAPKKHLARSSEPANVIVVADTDMLSDRFWLRLQSFMGKQVGVPFASNGDFVINALDNLSGSDALIGLRSRGLSFRPFDKIEEIRRAAEMRYREKERKLTAKLQETEEKIGKLREESQTEGSFSASREQEAAMETFRKEMLSLRQQLREVQHALRKDIERLDSVLKALNIWAVPVLVGFFAVVLALLRRARFRKQVLHS